MSNILYMLLPAWFSTFADLPSFHANVDFLAINSTNNTKMKLDAVGYPLPHFECSFQPTAFNKEIQRTETKPGSDLMLNVTVTTTSLFWHTIQLEFEPIASGNVTCVATNSEGFDDIEICVERDFSIYSFDANQTINVGQELTLLCISTVGEPDGELRLDWFLNGVYVPSAGGKP